MGGVIGFTLPTDQKIVVWDNSNARYADNVFPQGNNGGDQDVVAKTTNILIQDQASIKKNVPLDIIPWALAGTLAYASYKIAKKAKDKEGKPAAIAKYAWVAALGFGIVGAAGGGMLSTAMYKATV